MRQPFFSECQKTKEESIQNDYHKSLKAPYIKETPSIRCGMVIWHHQIFRLDPNSVFFSRTFYFILLIYYHFFSLVAIIYFKFARNINFQEMLGHVDAMYSQGPPSEPRSYTHPGMNFLFMF